MSKEGNQNSEVGDDGLYARYVASSLHAFRVLVEEECSLMKLFIMSSEVEARAKNQPGSLL